MSDANSPNDPQFSNEDPHAAPAPYAPADAPAPVGTEEPEEDNPMMNLFNGVLLLAFAGFLWWYFTDFENSNETSRRMNAILAMLYNIGGKWLAIAVVGGLGAWQAITGGLGMAKKKAEG